MTSRDPHAPGQKHSDEDEQVFAIVEVYMLQLEAGNPPDPKVLIAKHPTLANRLTELFASLTAIEMFGSDFQLELDSFHNSTQYPTLEDYEIVAELGRGGMGVVYEAVQKSLARRVALKVLPLASIFDRKNLQRFRNEALATAQLNHPNIIDVYSVGCEKGIHYYSMKLIEGNTLSQVIRSLQDSKDIRDPVDVEKLSRPAGIERIFQDSGRGSSDSRGNVQDLSKKTVYHKSAAILGIQAADALHHAHQLGIIHRDIKPSNLLLDSTGTVHVSDFGLATMQTEANLTATGDIVGTLRYMSPEQASGQLQRVDHRTDIYSLGATLYELLTCNAVVDAMGRKEILKRILFDTPTLPSQIEPTIPRDLETIVMKSLAKEKEQRYDSALDFAEDLQRFVDGQPIHAARPGLWQRFSLWRQRNPWFAATAATFAVSLLVGSISSSLLIYRWYDRAKLAEATLTKQNQTLNQALGRAKEAEGNLKSSNQRLLAVLSRVDLAEEQVAKMPALFIQRGDYFVENKHFKEAIELYQTAAELDPTIEAFCQIRCGECYYKLWDFPNAKRQAQNAINLLKANNKILSSSEMIKGVILHSRASIARGPKYDVQLASVDVGESFQYLQVSRLEEAAGRIDSILEIMPDNLEALELAAKLALLIAVQQPNSESFEVALKHATTVLDRSPQNREMLEIRFLSLWKLRPSEFSVDWNNLASQWNVTADGHLCLLQALANFEDQKKPEAIEWYRAGLRRLLHRSTGFNHTRLWIRNELIAACALKADRHFDAWNDQVVWSSLYNFRIDSTDLLQQVSSRNNGTIDKQSGMNRAGIEDWTPVSTRSGDANNGVHLFWRPKTTDTKLAFAINGSPQQTDKLVPFTPGRYHLTASLSKSYDYGIVQVWWNGDKVGDPIDLYHPTPIQHGATDFGFVKMNEGKNVLEFEFIGSNPNCVGQICMGVDYIDLWPEGFLPGRSTQSEMNRRFSNFRKRFSNALFPSQ